MRILYIFTDTLDEGETVRVQPDGDRLLIFMDSRADQGTLSRAMSLEVTRHARAEWLYVGSLTGAAG